MSDNEKKNDKVSLNVLNADIPADYYSQNPCLIGYSYIRFEVNGTIAPCCVAKHAIGNAYEQDWRDVWHSGAYENFRRKMSRIHVDKFHLNDPEWTFCQQCSHLSINTDNNNRMRGSKVKNEGQY
jgi:radical SAM protein with 4Fe4S-binding SPASM domain